MRNTNIVFNQKHADVSRCVANERVNSTDRLDPGTTIIGDDAETDVVQQVRCKCLHDVKPRGAFDNNHPVVVDLIQLVNVVNSWYGLSMAGRFPSIYVNVSSVLCEALLRGGSHIFDASSRR